MNDSDAQNDIPKTGLPEKIELGPELMAPIPVLDHGFVRLIEHMGSDKAIVDSARLSYGEGTRAISADRALLRYLWRHQHTSPFEQAELRLEIKCPIFVARQLFRHRTVSANEMSGRYSVLPEETYVPSGERLQAQDADNKQGSGRALDVKRAIQAEQLIRERARDDFVAYRELLDEQGLSRELARIVTPVSTYTHFVWKQNLRNLLHLLCLRLSNHAQQEIRVYAEAMASLVSVIYPETWTAFCDYELHSQRFSRGELDVLGRALATAGRFLGRRRLDEMATSAGLENERERSELEAKLVALGMIID